MFLAVVFILSTRSKILLQFFVAHPDADLTDLSILPKLYDLALQHGPQLGDAGTVHAAATSLGNLIDSILLPYWRQPQEHPVTALVQCRRIRDARELLMQIPHFGELAMAHVFSYIAAMDKGLQRLSWSQQKLPDAQLPLAANARAWLALRRAGRELTKSPGWLEEEARNWVQTMQAMMPKTVTYRRHSDGVEVEWKPQITRSLCQANSCKSLQVLQTWLSGMLGNHGRKSAADMLPSWRRKRWGPKRKRTLGFDPETVPKCSIVNTAFNDANHPVNGGYVASANQCQETCQTVWYCESFTYNVTSKACHLLGDSAAASPSQHVVSGPVKCGQRLLLKFVSIHDAMRSMSNSALQAAQEARLAGKGLTAQLHAAKTTVESFTAEADFSRSDQVQMASVAVAECAARVAKEAGLDTERQLHAASHAARKAAQEAGMTDQEQWQQVTTAAAATALFLPDTPMTRDQRSREARLAAQKVSLVSPFAPEVQVAQSAKAVQIAMAFTGSQTSDLPVLASQAARLSAAAIHLPEARTCLNLGFLGEDVHSD
ncbi:hypothetical protein AK812_SmicGene5225 [Symbiodinium microadriaticum]|uniref:Apple domain-containing protein n=1 Tax=Symbiodinium microadriaticum TaxID=2951 RepID=A0A1Q9EUA8_SYMMI|nr:hypothetical protein AK812_SmicGene5225 [Symbiodinium microadriaticum]